MYLQPHLRTAVATILLLRYGRVEDLVSHGPEKVVPPPLRLLRPPADLAIASSDRSLEISRSGSVG
jgi:hypothetical protein